jgi:hypothetical protein
MAYAKICRRWRVSKQRYATAAWQRESAYRNTVGDITGEPHLLHGAV